MGYGIMPYSVNINVLRKPHAYTSDPEEFLEWIQGRHCTGGEFDPTPEAMRELFYNEPFTGDGHIYGYTLKALCGVFGGHLDNGFWHKFGSGWLDTVQTALAGAGVRFDPNDLVYSGSPVPLPPIDDFPLIGYVEREEALRLAAELDAADLSAIEDASVAGGVAELHGWLKACNSVEGDEFNSSDLVCFYH
ncbi:hypothetical protein OG582_32265 [Streptomyces anulatus]|uniref:DUF7691 family protein n=2 Tax=Streptomyces TaxID=1883 RepID=UPI000241A5D2|nr:hypothetical protein SPW_7800 [Streptomyces sp. W007]